MSVHLSRRAQITIWLQASATAVSVVGVTLWLEATVLVDISRSYPLRLGTALGMTYLLAAGGISLHLLVSKWRGRLARRRVDRESPPIRAALTAHALGQIDMVGLAERYHRYPRVFRETMLELLAVIEGNPHERLVHVAERLGVANRWLREAGSSAVRRRLAAVRAMSFTPTREARRVLRRALTDAAADVQLAAAQALVRHGHPSDLEHVLEYTSRQAAWTRAILGQAMRASAAVLDPRVIRTALADENADPLVAMLEFVRLWRVRLPHDDVGSLHAHPDPRVRALAIDVLPQLGELGSVSV